MEKNNEHFEKINSFDVSIQYSELYADASENVNISHTHDECEIYINLSGDVSFIVENNIYFIKPGDIIITRPHEYHYCVYRSNKLHKFFWILFSPSDNEHLYDVFFDRRKGSSNLLALSDEDTEALVSVCHKMTTKEPSQIKKYYNFFKLINILQNVEFVKETKENYMVDVSYAIKYINSHLSEAISIREIAKNAYVSINTLERHFMQTLKISPIEYIKSKRLTNAKKLLSIGYTVAEASSQSGFPDYSHFIALFKKTYGMTPLKYKKSMMKDYSK